MTAHTPGPWGASRNDNGSWSVDNGHGYIVARCANTGRHAESETTEADARLIAAAPELLEALQFFVAPFAGLEVVPDGFIAKARTAIAKAKGESHGR